MIKKHYIFGLGTGRCGTVSLSRLLNLQRGANITHEQRPWLPWNTNNGLIKSKVSHLKKRNSNIVGEVALFYLKSIKVLLDLLPNAKFIVLKRDKNKTINSYVKKWKHRPINKMCIKKVEWDYVYPGYHPSLSLEKSIIKYYDEYYKITTDLESQFPLHVKCFNTDSLNNRSGVTAILDFCEICKKNRIYKIGITQNKGK